MAQLKTIDVRDLSCGPTQLGVIDTKNDLYMLGRQLNSVWQEPTKIMSNVEQVSCCKDFTAILTKAGQLFAFGSNSHKQLGDSIKAAAISEPKLLKSQAAMIRITPSDSSKSSILSLSTTSKLWCGLN